MKYFISALRPSHNARWFMQSAQTVGMSLNMSITMSIPFSLCVCATWGDCECVSVWVWLCAPLQAPQTKDQQSTSYDSIRLVIATNFPNFVTIARTQPNRDMNTCVSSVKWNHLCIGLTFPCARLHRIGLWTSYKQSTEWLNSTFSYYIVKEYFWFYFIYICQSHTLLLADLPQKTLYLSIIFKFDLSTLLIISRTHTGVCISRNSIWKSLSLVKKIQSEESLRSSLASCK